MKFGKLADYFEGVGVKRLCAVDAEPKSSNQHEVGTTREMRRNFLGENASQRYAVRYVWLGDDEVIVRDEGRATHYDTRRNNPQRAAEWRLYYSSNDVTKAMRAGDSLFLAKDRHGVLWFIVAPENSTVEQQLCWFFGLRPGEGNFVSREVTSEDPELEFAARYIFDALGIPFEDPEGDDLDGMIEHFGDTFPSTDEFSRHARTTLRSDIRPEDDADLVLIAWLGREEALFRRLERRVVANRIQEGFLEGSTPNVDEAIQFFLSVSNRRKSRMGHSLENHVAEVLTAHGIQYARGAITERNYKPDFLFPSVEAYRTADAEDPRLNMLGVKSTCKDRWRQVLAEAAKITDKHLLTLEAGITEAQTSQMRCERLQLVVPKGIQSSYTDVQRAWLWSLTDFIECVKDKQKSEKT